MKQKTQNHFLTFSIHLSVSKSRENYRQKYGKSKASLWRNSSTGTPQIFLGQSFALQLQFTINIYFRTAILQKLFDITFSYKHCNFSRVCLLVNRPHALFVHQHLFISPLLIVSPGDARKPPINLLCSFANLGRRPFLFFIQSFCRIYCVIRVNRSRSEKYCALIPATTW